MQLRSCYLGVVIYFFLGAVIPGLVYAAAPPLQAHEEIVKTADGCGMVIDKTGKSATYVREAFSKLTWGGACVDGLAMGEGILSPGFKFPDQPGMLPITGWVWYGRPFGPSETRWDNGSIQKNFGWETKSVSYNTLDPSRAVWSKTVAEASRVNDGETMVSAMVYDKPVVSVNPVNDFSRSVQHPCPKNKKSPAGCEKLWMQHAGPVIERIQAFLAENEPKASARVAEVQTLVAEWKAKAGPAVVAQREADARRAAGEQYERAAKKAEWDKGCWDKINKGQSGFDFTSEGYTKRAAYLRNLFKGECAGHHYEAEGLKEADRLLAEVPKLQKDEAEAAKYAAEEKAQSVKDSKQTAELLGKVVGAALSGSNSQERKDNVINVLAGGSGKRAKVTGFRLGTSIYDSTSDVEDASACISLERKDYPETGLMSARTDFKVQNNCSYDVSMVVCFTVDTKFSDCAGRYPKEIEASTTAEFRDPGTFRTGSVYKPDDPNQQVFVVACRQLYGNTDNPRDHTIMTVWFDPTDGMSFKCVKNKPPVYGD